MRRDSPDSRYTSNMIANRFKPLIAYTNPTSASTAFDRSPAIVNLPPAAGPTPAGTRNGHVGKREGADVDHLTKLLLKSMNSSNEPNFFGECSGERKESSKRSCSLSRNVCPLQWWNRRRREWTGRHGSHVSCLMFYMYDVWMSSTRNAFLFHGE